jgi:hypothetical protein
MKIIPLQAKQVSEANLRSEQGGINFPRLFSSSHMQKKKKKKLNSPYGWGSAQKCLSVVCLSQVRPQLSFEPLV